MRMRSLSTLAALAVLGPVAAACSSTPNVPINGGGTGPVTTGPTPSAVVNIQYVSFEPSRITIHAGQTVEWVWKDAPIDHNVSFASFASPTQSTGTYFHTFDTPGTYSYRCTIHATMTGQITVLP
ncbi:MAG: cupredoxin domain-containing protein [Acidimicrobiales bacterium]